MPERSEKIIWESSTFRSFFLEFRRLIYIGPTVSVSLAMDTVIYTKCTPSLYDAKCDLVRDAGFDDYRVITTDNLI